MTLVDGVRVVVPDSLNLITPYVLREQEDWFEDEIKFLRRLLKRGQRVIDIGANYGVYTLSMAKAVGPTGRVWAFEPASSTASRLAEGITVNNFAHVTLERSALSSSSGTARLSLNQDSELNSLVRGNSPANATETVPLATLDQLIESAGWQDIEFVKMDAEGEEANILRGGKRFFSEMSPLVQYEVKADTHLHMDLVQAFAALGYGSYRLVPGLDLLVRFDAAEQPDGYLLNLFCCKPDRAARLADEGFLLASGPDRRNAENQGISNETIRDGGRDDAYDWRHTIAKLRYGARLAGLWEQTVAAGHSGEVVKALSSYARSRDASLSAARRFNALESSFNRLRLLCERDPSHLRLASLARAALDYGARSLAVNALWQLSHSISQHKTADPSEPFLVPGERFDSIPPGDALGNWILAAVLEELERKGSFSSYYTGPSARQRLEAIRDLGFGSPEMQRRLSLLQRCFGK
jgi:FkbM family methyltransferase